MSQQASPPAESYSVLQQQLEEEERKALEAIKEDLCQWLTKVLGTSITPSSFFDCLQTGVLPCNLARLIQDAAKGMKDSQIPMDVVECNNGASPGSFAARVNASNFISWCRSLGVNEAVIFESEGLVLSKDERRVILCLLEVARFAVRVGISPPQLVQMEREIDDDEGNPKPQEKAKKPEETPEEKAVLKKMEGCTCSEPLSVIACGNNKFIIRGGTIRGEKTLHARILRDRILVRVGGGWVTLKHFLLEHDPCRVKKLP